jgi:hypothetical protein
MRGNKQINNFILKLERAKENNDSIIIMDKDSSMNTTKVVYVDYIGSRWAKCHSYAYLGDEKIELPETINYSDIINTGVGIGFEVLFSDGTVNGDMK